MAEHSKIQWCHATFNMWRGCTKVSAGCAHCYAETLSARNPAVLGVWGPTGTRVVAADAQWRGLVKWNAAAAHSGERYRVFCASLADVFEQWTGPMIDSAGRQLYRSPTGVWSNAESDSPVTEPGCPPLTMDDVRARLLCLIHQTPCLDWLLLTKRPQSIRSTLERLAARPDDAGDLAKQWLYGSPMPNIWLGVSVENQAAADERIPHLLATPATVRFLSCEPLLGPVSLTDQHWWDHRYEYAYYRAAFPAARPPIDWVIVGGESGPGARPMQLQWARSLVAQCKAAGVACFVKQLGAAPHEVASLDRPGNWSGPLDLKDKKGGDPSEWPTDLRVREFPQVPA